jgi:membrane protein
MKLISQILRLFYKAGDNLVDNDGIELAGYLTFLALLSLFPFLVLIVAIAGFIGQGELGREFITLLITHLPKEAVSAIEPRIQEIMSGPPQGLLTISIFGTLWTSSSAVEGFRTVLNRAYRVSNPPTYVLRRLLSIVQVVLFTVLIIIVMSVLVLAPIFMNPLVQWLGLNTESITRFVTRDFIYIGAVIIFISVSSLYFVLPNIRHKLSRVIPGAALVVVLWILGAQGLSLYLNNVHQVNLIYGSLSGFIATLLFFFVMNVIFIYGAEFNHQLFAMLGERVEEKEHAAISADDAVIRKKSLL